MKTLLVLTLINILTLPPISGNIPYKNQKLDFKSGIFYQDLGQVKLTQDYFTLLSFNNISIYEMKLKFAEKSFYISKPLCMHPNDKNVTFRHSEFLCKESLELIEIRLEKLNKKLEAINHLTGHEPDKMSLRVKRGLINGVSYTFKWLFGIPDADDAEYYNDAIHAVVNQNQDMQKLLKQQVHIISEAISGYNRSALTLKFNEEKLNKNIKIFNKFSNSSIIRINSLTYVQTVMDHLNLLSQITEELDEEFDVIISSILFSKQNILHPSIITPKSLREELLKINNKRTDLDFPIDLDDNANIFKYTQICSLSVVYTNKVLIYAIKIPLVTKDLYQLYNLIPLPVQYQNSSIYSYINPSFPYLILSTTRTYYGEMSELSKCQKISPSEYICSNIIIHLIKERPTCETILKLQKPEKIPSNCDTKTMKSEIEVWHPLSTNQWLYILTQPVTGTISCENYGASQITDVVLQGSGIFTLQPKCKCYTTSTLLTSTSNQTSNYTNFIPLLDINKDDCCIKEQSYLKNEEITSIKLHSLNLNELSHAQHKLQQFDDVLQKNINQPFIINHSKWYNIFFGIIGTLVMLIICYYVCCRCCRCRFLNSIKKYFNPDQCRHLVCINSHNTVSDNRVNLDDFPPHRRSYRSLNSEADAMPMEDLEPVYTEMRKPRLSKKSFKI